MLLMRLVTEKAWNKQKINKNLKTIILQKPDNICEMLYSVCLRYAHGGGGAGVILKD